MINPESRTREWIAYSRAVRLSCFTGVKEISRESRTNVPKSHAAYEYLVSYPAGYSSGEILLDVLYEDIDYTQVLTLPIESPLLKIDGS